MTQISCLTFFHRPRLMATLRRALERPLLSITAPIGYGKTLTAREVLPPDASWQTLVSDSPAMFWEKVGSFVRPFLPKLAERIAEMGTPSSEIELDELLSHFDKRSFSSPVYFVLDDCHVLTDAMCWQFLELLARRQVPHLHVVLLSRSRPPMALEDLQLKGLAQEIGIQELSFTAEDILEFFCKNGLTISEADSQVLYEATNGWISAICLYGLGYISYTEHVSPHCKAAFKDFLGTYENEQMYRLLEETVFRTCTGDEKKFLVAMGQFDSFTQDAVDFIIERLPDVTTPPRQILYDLLISNSFIRKNTLENRYEIHPTLLSFLRKRLSLHNRKLQDFLYTLMGDWYIHTDSPASAVHWYLTGHQFEKIWGILVSRPEVFNDFSNKPALIHFFNDCPISVKRKHLLACLLCAKFLLLYDEPSLFKRAVFEVQSMVNDLPAGLEQNRAQGELELLLCFTYFNRLDEMYAHLMRAALLMDGKPSRVVGKDFPFGFGANDLTSVLYREPGTLSKMNETFAEMMPVYMTLVPGGGDGAMALLDAEQAYYQGDWNRSYDLAHEAMDKALESDQTTILLMGYHLLLQLSLLHGDYREYELVQKEIRRATQTENRAEIRYSAEITQAGALLLAAGDEAQIPEWILRGRFYSKDLPPQVQICAYMRYGRILMEKKSFSLFLKFYRDMENINRHYPSNILMIYADMYLAASHLALGDRKRAEEAMLQAMARAKADRIYMPFVQNLQHFPGLLAFMQEQHPDFMVPVLRLRQDYERGVKAMTPALSLARLFTERENQIIDLLKRGYTTKQISAELFIAEITVKKNVARIAEKLGVKGRMNILRKLSENERRPKTL